MKGYVCAHGERLIEGTLEIEKKIACEELPRPMRLPIFHIRHFPSIVRPLKPNSVGRRGGAPLIVRLVCILGDPVPE